MSPALPFFLSALLLLLPWSLGPLPTARSPEIRGPLRLLWWLNRLYCGLLHRLETDHASLPEHGPAILIANHTCGIDHLVLQAGCRRVLGFMVAQEFYDHPIVGRFCRLIGCIPVRRDGHDLAATRAAIRALEAGRVVPIFPEGRITPRSGREFGEPKPGAAFIALRSGVPVIPAYIAGTPPTNDVFRAVLWPSSARVVYGEPVGLDDLRAGHADRDVLARATDRLMGAIRDLKDRADRDIR